MAVSHPDRSRDVVLMATELAGILRGRAFLEMILTGPRVADLSSWLKVVLRPEVVRGTPVTTFDYFDRRSRTTKHHDEEAAGRELSAVLATGFRSVFVRLDAGAGTQYRVTKRGKVLRIPQRGGATQSAPAGAGPADAPAWARVAGLIDEHGRPLAAARRKHAQVLRFLEELDPYVRRHGGGALRIYDFGCGNGYLTMGARELARHCGVSSAAVTGVDVDGAAILRGEEKRRALGWEDVRFEAGSIRTFTPPPDPCGSGPQEPAIVLALHACDTATDEAIAKGVELGAALIAVAPCCHRDLSRRLADGRPAGAWGELAADPVTRNRFAAATTDLMRCLLLRAAGYRARLVQFVASEHSPQNTLLLAERTGTPDPSAPGGYQELRASLGAPIVLEELLGEISVLPMMPWRAR